MINTISCYQDKLFTVNGWVYNKRSSGKVQFLIIRDGSGFVQVVVSVENLPEPEFQIAFNVSQESSVSITGIVTKDVRAPFCGFEIQATSFKLVSYSLPYPITKKEHGDAFLLNNRHLWLRSMRQNTILRIRATAVKCIRDYFDNNGFILLDSPIFTPNACEGTSTLFETNWFDGRKAFLSQSGQLYQEACCMAFGKTYCFGPTFRAEKSKTRRHLNEFWMVEPEVAFMDLHGLIDLAEDFLCYIISCVLNKHSKDLTEILGRDISILANIRKPFPRLSYSEAVKKINSLGLLLEDGQDLGAPHETELTKLYTQPVIITHFPSSIKAFYMKQSQTCPGYVECLDILAPEGYGEIIGGGQREDDFNILSSEVEKHNLNKDDLSWFLDLRRFGSVPHSGFGLGLERFVRWVCGLHHIRETIPFPRTIDRLSP